MQLVLRQGEILLTPLSLLPPFSPFHPLPLIVQHLLFRLHLTPSSSSCLRLRNAELAVAIAPSRADVHEFLGHALLDMYEHHPGHRSDAALLQQAEESFRRSLLLEGKPFQPLTDQLEGVTTKPTGTASKAPLKTPAQSVGRGRGKPENVVKGGAKSPASKPANASTGNGKEKAEEGEDRKEEKLVNPRSSSSRIGLAKVLTEKGGDPTAFPADLIASVTSLYEESIEINPRDFEAYFKIGELLDLKDPKRAAAIYRSTPSSLPPSSPADLLLQPVSCQL